MNSYVIMISDIQLNHAAVINFLKTLISQMDEKNSR